MTENENNNNEENNNSILIDHLLDQLKEEAEELIKESQQEQPVKKTKKVKKGEIITAEQVLPNRLPVIPIQGRPIFPGIFTPLMISNQEDIKAVEQAYGTVAPQ